MGQNSVANRYAASKDEPIRDAAYIEQLKAHALKAMAQYPNATAFRLGGGIRSMITDEYFDLVCWLMQQGTWIDLFQYARANNAKRIMSHVLDVEWDKLNRYLDILDYALHVKDARLVNHLLDLNVQVLYNHLSQLLSFPKEHRITLYRRAAPLVSVASKYAYRIDDPVIRSFDIYEFVEILELTLKQNVLITFTPSVTSDVLDQLLIAKTTPLYDRLWELLIQNKFDWYSNTNPMYGPLIADYFQHSKADLSRYSTLFIQMDMESFKKYIATNIIPSRIFDECLSRYPDKFICLIEACTDWCLVDYLTELIPKYSTPETINLYRTSFQNCNRKVSVSTFLNAGRSFKDYLLFRTDLYKHNLDAILTVDDDDDQFVEWKNRCWELFDSEENSLITDLSELKPNDLVMCRTIDDQGRLISDVLLQFFGVRGQANSYYFSNGYSFEQPIQTPIKDDWAAGLGYTSMYTRKQKPSKKAPMHAKYYRIFRLKKPYSLVNLCTMAIRKEVRFRDTLALPNELRSKIYIHLKD